MSLQACLNSYHLLSSYTAIVHHSNVELKLYISIKLQLLKYHFEGEIDFDYLAHARGGSKAETECSSKVLDRYNFLPF